MNRKKLKISLFLFALFEIAFSCAFKTDIMNKNLAIYSLAEPIRDISGEREIRNRIFDLRQ
jgi:hypothetical protein